jgi:hypothetical protein
MSKGTGYIIYFLSLLAAYMVYWLYSLLSVIGFISFLSFLSSVLHFGISSWLFLFLKKSGRVLSITTGILMAIWPIQVTFNSLVDKEYSLLLYYLLPVIFSLITTSIHILNITRPASTGRISRIVMASVPSVLFLIYVWYVTVESIREGALNIVF